MTTHLDHVIEVAQAHAESDNPLDRLVGQAEVNVLRSQTKPSWRQVSLQNLKDGTPRMVYFDRFVGITIHRYGTSRIYGKGRRWETTLKAICNRDRKCAAMVPGGTAYEV